MIRAPAGASRCDCTLSVCSTTPSLSKNIAPTAFRAGSRCCTTIPSLGSRYLAHLNDKARVSPPHDHGASWAIYGQATKYTDMIEWEREDNGADPKHAALKPGEEIPRSIPATPAFTRMARSTPSTIRTAPRFVRVTGTNLDKINRIRIDIKTGEVHQMTPQQAT